MGIVESDDELCLDEDDSQDEEDGDDPANAGAISRVPDDADAVAEARTDAAIVTEAPANADAGSQVSTDVDAVVKVSANPEPSNASEGATRMKRQLEYARSNAVLEAQLAKKLKSSADAD